MGERLIGVDVGGTKVSVAVLEEGRLSEPALRQTDLSHADAPVAHLVAAIEEAGPAHAGRGRPPVRQPAPPPAAALVAQLAAAMEGGGPADAVGVGLPSVIDWETGTARSSVNIPLQGVPLRGLLGDRLGVPVFVDNDATVAA